MSVALGGPPPKALMLLGPTASGKTALAMDLVDRFAVSHPLEIISVDSALVYRDMNIGTAKPDPVLLARYPHHLLDLIAPTEAYSAAAFCKDAIAAMNEIVARGHTPLMVGGTMLYAKALLEGLSDLPEADADVRDAIEARAATEGWPQMHAELALVDPATAARLKPNDAQRIQRALEVWQLTGTPISALQQRAASDYKLPFEMHVIGLVPAERAVLHQRIADRFDAMLAAGLVDELRCLKARYPLNADMPSMRAVGYRQAWEFLEGRFGERMLRDTGIAATRQLAKRQMTWLRAMPYVTIFDSLAADFNRRAIADVEAFFERTYSPS
jgi:tRNA dimethylallyltransferase